jgi:hypothetical protein
MIRSLVLGVCALALVSCATNSQKRNLLTLGAFAAGAAVGAATAPKDERQDLHAVYWGAIAGLGAAVIGNSLYNDEASIELLQKENKKLQAEMDLIQTGNKILLDQGNGKFKNPVGETEFQGKKAHWKMYQVDRWSKEGNGRLYHQDRMIEILPEGEK